MGLTSRGSKIKPSDMILAKYVCLGSVNGEYYLIIVVPAAVLILCHVPSECGTAVVTSCAMCHQSAALQVWSVGETVSARFLRMLQAFLWETRKTPYYVDE
jgi:hypothetical protein